MPMSETDEKQPRQDGQNNRPRRLELHKTVETGQVRQSFSHGRSKMVTVEVRKKRTFAPDSRGRMAEVRREAEREGGRGSGRGGEAALRDGAAVGLTKQEKAARARALEEARRAEEERQVAPVEARTGEAWESDLTGEEAEIADFGHLETTADEEGSAGPLAEPAEGTPPVPEETVASAAEPEAGPAPGEEKPAPTPDAGQAAAAVMPDVVAETGARSSAAAPAGGVKPAGKPAEPGSRVVRPSVATEEEEAQSRTKPRRPARADLRRPDEAKRDEAGRRSGKISIFDALDDSAERMRSLASVRRARQKERLKQAQTSRQEAQKVIRDVIIPETITVQELANRMAERGSDVIKALMRMGMMVTINHTLDADTAELIANEFGHHVKRVSEADVEVGLRGEPDEHARLVSRPPVVTVMGHVDHGKTSLLDALRRTDVAAHEAGGITQHIGAYQVTMPGGERITFIDTPGHEAFTQMRARGARATDVVVLVVAADDGVMPQTVEAVAHAKAAGVPIIVAINKIDRPDADPRRIRTDLMQHGVFVEDMGGETLCIEVSAKTGANLDKLTEAILLQAELLDLRSNPDRPAEGIIIESKMERGRGPVATVLVQRGTLAVGDIFVAGSEWGRVRSLMDAAGAAVDAAGPSTPVEVLGLNGPPAAGDDVIVVDSESRAREVSEFRQRRLRDARTTTTRGSLEQMMSRIQEGEAKDLPVVVKADVHGSVEAIAGALEKVGGDQIKVNVLHAGVGGINETDVGLARASGALIIGFNVRANPQAREVAKRDGVEIRYYSIIYDLIDDIRSVLTGMLAPTLKEKVIGYAEIRQVFTISKVGKVAGCMVTEGMVRRGARVRLLRDSVVIHSGDLGQLKRFKEDVREVKEGYDCGISLANYHDIQVGDMIECFELEEVAKEL
jgi:translation initiation factor IF-2